MTQQKEEEQKEFLGMPMNWDSKNMFKNFWNTERNDIFPPKRFGIGWDINFHALFKSIGVIGKKDTSRDQKNKNEY